MTKVNTTSNRIAALRAQLDRYDTALSGVQARLDEATSEPTVVPSSGQQVADGAPEPRPAVSPLEEKLAALIAEQARVGRDLSNLEQRLAGGGSTEMDVRTATGLFTIRLEQLRIERERLEGELTHATRQRSSSKRAISDESIVATNPELAADVAQVLRELEYVRAQARAMMAERDRLRGEIQQLEAVRARLQAGLQQPRTYHGPERRSEPQGTFDLEATPAEGDAFDRFFNAETGRDKAREWMLG